MNPMFLTLGWQQFIENPIIILLSVGLFVITTVSCVTVIIYSRRRRQSLNEVMLEIEANSQAQSLPTTADDDDDDDDDVDHTDDTDTDNNIETATAPPPPTWADQIKTSLANTRSQLSSQLASILTKHQVVDEQQLTNIKEVLIRADLGSHTTEKLITQLRSHLRTHSTTGHRILQELAAQLVAMLQQHSPPFTPFTSPRSPRSPSNEHELRIILITGVNGVGKTTTTGKLGYYFQQQGQKVVLCAADTFRAGAIDQLKVWGERLNLDVIATHQGADPAAVCYQGIEQAIKTKTDILVIDTAGRLHNKTNLMAELAKIQRVIKKLVPAAPHEIWLVVDGTTGQNATKQAHAFKEILPLTGLVITKLDGTAKGGAVVGISHQLKLPIRFIGLGEQAQDLSPFDATTYVAGLLHTDEIFTPQE